MNFLENILSRLTNAPERQVLVEMRPVGTTAATARELLDRIAGARAFFAAAGLRKGDRCALIAPNGVAWVVFDLAAMAEGIIVVPLYARQAAGELVAIIRDCQPRLVCCGDEGIRDALRKAWSDPPAARDSTSAPTMVLLEEVTMARSGAHDGTAAVPIPLAPEDAVTIIYTSGTSGDAKGVILTAGNVTHMLGCTTARLDELMRTPSEKNKSKCDEVFHYLPFCFAGSWILLLSCLSRASKLSLCIDLARLADDLRAASPNYCLNVPALLERMRSAVEGQLASRGGTTYKIFCNAKTAWLAAQNGSTPRGSISSAISLTLGRTLIFPAIRKKLGRNLKALICGSAPLAVETQLFFMMLGISVLQVYGLTETTAICTMDDPHHVQPGCVGPAIPGVEMKLGDADEILVKGPNIFAGYWNRPDETANSFANGWFRTGDQGERTPSGNWRVIGRLKNLLILNSGHNIAPEPLEETLLRSFPGAQQAVLFGNGRSFLTALITGDVRQETAEAEIARFNAARPHYQQIRAVHIERQPLTIESGLLTANGKLRREAIALRFRDEIEAMYRNQVRQQAARTL